MEHLSSTIHWDARIRTLSEALQSPYEIHEKISTEARLLRHCHPPSISHTIAVHTAHIARPPALRLPYATFSWPNSLAPTELPWSASSFILKMCNLVRWIQGPPTNRQVTWWWRVSQALPELPLTDAIDAADIFWLAQQFVTYEITADFLKEPPNFGALEALFSYRPWSGWPDNTTNFEAYRLAIKQGHIQPVASITQVIKAMAISLPLNWPGGPSHVHDLITGNQATTTHPELLFSQQLEMLDPLPF